MTLGQRIKDLREEHHLTQEEFSKIIGISKSAVGMYETNKREPNLETLDAIADFFNVDMDYLRGKSDCRNRFQWAQEHRQIIPPGFQPMPPMTPVPLVGQIACGDPITAEENLEGVINVPEAWSATFVLTCHGDSMEPKIKDGDLVAIRKQDEVENGQIAAVRIENEATLKKVYLYPDRLELRPINPDYESIVLYGDEINTAAIEGRAVGLCRGL